MGPQFDWDFGTLPMSDEQKDNDKQDGWRLPFLEGMPVSPVLAIAVALLLGLLVLLLVYLLLTWP